MQMAWIAPSYERIPPGSTAEQSELWRFAEVVDENVSGLPSSQSRRIGIRFADCGHAARSESTVLPCVTRASHHGWEGAVVIAWSV